MKIKENNFAFIDGQNLYYRTKYLDWSFDYGRFRIYLKDKYHIQKAFIFLGYIESQNCVYETLRDFGYEIIFKEVARDNNGKIKGNVDVDLTLHSLIKTSEYHKAIIVTSDGDFSPLINYLDSIGKFENAISVTKRETSFLLRKDCGWKRSIKYIEDIRHLVEKVNESKKEKRLPLD